MAHLVLSDVNYTLVPKRKKLYLDMIAHIKNQDPYTLKRLLFPGHISFGCTKVHNADGGGMM